MLILRPNKINSLKLFKVACLCFERTTAYPLGGPGNTTPSGGRDGVPASEIFVREIQPVTCTSEKNNFGWERNQSQRNQIHCYLPVVNSWIEQQTRRSGVVFISSHLCLWRHPSAIIYIYISLIQFPSEYPDKKFREGPSSPKLVILGGLLNLQINCEVYA